MPAPDFLIAEFQERPLPEPIPRLVSIPRVARKAAVVIGMRRTGKTFFMYQQIRSLLAAGTAKRDILYVNFEDDRLEADDPQLLSQLLEAFYRSNPAVRDGRAYLFLDEIQLLSGWPRFVRRVLDTENAQVVLGGSSAKLLSSEVATELRGRGMPVEIFPFSFRESAAAAGIAFPEAAPPGARTRAQLEAHFDAYLAAGGFPEVQGMTPADRIQTLQDYIELVLLRDVIERHRMENAVAARAFARLLLQSPARSFTVNKGYLDLRSRGLKVSKDTLHALLDHFQDAYLLFAIPVFRKSIRAQATNPRKLYVIDPGLAGAMSHLTATDVGARLENAVFLALRRHHGRMIHGEVSYYITGTGREVDFVVGDVSQERATRLVQACVDLSAPGVRELELGALVEAMQETGLPQGEIVSLRDEETIDTEAGRIRVVPAWAWMLQQH